MLEIKKDDIIISIKGKQKKETYRGFLDFEPITVNIPKRKGDARGYPPYKWSLTADNLKLIISKLRAEKLPASISTSVSEDSSIIELVKCGPKAAGVIKAIREALDLGLKEAHDIVKSAPVDLPGPLTKTQGVLLHQTLEELGATVNLK